MARPYPGLPREVVATVPRRAPLRHSWVRDTPLITTPINTSIAEPVEVEVSPYQPSTPVDELSCTTGRVSRARAVFESPPHAPSPPPKQEKPPETASVVTLRVRSPYAPTPPRPAKRRHTLSTPNVNKHGDLIPTPEINRPPLVTIKKITPVLLPSFSPRYPGGREIEEGSGELQGLGEGQRYAKKEEKESEFISSSELKRPPLLTARRIISESPPPRFLGYGEEGEASRKVEAGRETQRLGKKGEGGENSQPSQFQQTPSRPAPSRSLSVAAGSQGEAVIPAVRTPQARDVPACPSTMLGARPHPRHHPRPHSSPATPYKRFSDIPRHLLECLQESSVDGPSDASLSTPGGIAGKEGGGEGMVGDIHTPTHPHNTPHPHPSADITESNNASPPTTPTQPSPPSTLIRENFRGFCSTMLDAPPRPSSPKHARTPTLDEELWAAGVYFRRPGSPPRSNPGLREIGSKETGFKGNGFSKGGFSGPGLREPTIMECELEESVLKELDSSLAGLSGSNSSTTSEESVRNATSRTQPEPLNLIEEVVVESHPAPSPSPPSPPPPSTVTLRAYYQYPSPVPQPLPVQDSDSGHESGATSPCGTLTGEDGSHTPPSSPPTAHQSLGVGVSVVGGDSGCVGVGGVSLEPRPPTHFVVVAIDFGTTYSGYAFSFTSDPESVHMMKQWQGGDPGVQNQKTPTTLLLTPDGRFHSLGYLARDTYHDLDPSEAPKWLYFDKFKMVLHNEETLSRDTQIEASNGRRLPALQVFSHALRYFRDHALRELSDQAGVGGGVGVLEEDVRWVITVPAIWSHPAKQFMRTAAYQAGMGSPSRPDQLLIALEPEVAAIYCRRLRRHQLLPPPSSYSSSTRSLPPHLQEDAAPPPSPDLDRDTVYAVVDCGGGTVDITVHQMTDRTSGHLKELHKATGGAHGSTGVDEEFEKLLETIFSRDFLMAFKKQRPAAHVDLMIAFEARKRNASPRRSSPLNIALPFSFIDLYRKLKGRDVESAVRKHHHLGVRWSSQGMLRLEPEAMKQLFLPTLNNITKAIEDVFACPEVRALQYMFLVGGFAESEVLQKHLRDAFCSRVRVVIPQGTGLAILRGAVQYGLDPGIVTVRRSRLTYGVGVLNRYNPAVHPRQKRVTSSGGEWCADILDRFVVVDESVAVGDVVVRSYTPATPAQRTVILHLYATDRHDAEFVTEPGVERVGTLHLDLGPAPHHHHHHHQSVDSQQKREISVHMKFGDTEVKATAVDHLTQRCVRADIDFLTL